MTHALVPAAIAAGLGQRVIPARLLVAGAIAALRTRSPSPPRSPFPFPFLFAAVASHGALDAFTNGGSGIEFLWPFSDERYFAPPARGVELLKSEVIWIWLPTLALAATLFAARRNTNRQET